MSESFPYRAKPGMMLLLGLLAGIGTAAVSHEAATNDRGLIINGFIELGPTGATIFYAVIAGLSALFVLAAAFATIYGLVKSRG